MVYVRTGGASGKEVREVFFTVCPVESTSHIAVHKGFLNEAFKSIGVDLKHISSLPKDLWNIHYTHEHPTFFRDGGNIPPIWTRSRGADNVVIGLTFPFRRQVVLVKKESPIQSLHDLKGKRVALPNRKGPLVDFWKATVHRGILLSLLANGMDRSDVRFIDVFLEDYFAGSGGDGSIWAHKSDFQSFIREEIAALEEGAVDAIYTEGARASGILRTNRFRAIYELSSNTELYYKVNLCIPCCITTSGELARNHPEIVQKYVEAVVAAGIWAKDHREEVLDIFSKELFLDRECVANSFPENFHELLVPRLDNEAIKALETEMFFLRDHGYITKDFEIGQWVDGSFIENGQRDALKFLDSQG